MDPKAWPTSGQNVCRCCLAEGCYKDISTEYFWMGKREVYSDMLNETFDVNISFSKSGSTNSRLICEPCISRLRDASEFKKQVVDCERMFMNHLSEPGSSTMAEPLSTLTPDDVKVIKVEAVKQEKDSDGDEDFADTTDFLDDDDDDEDDLDNQPLTKFATKVPKKEAVDIMDLLDNTELTIKRKAPTKTKAVPAKKAKTTTKVTAKATVSKAKTAARPKTAAATKAVVEKKKKGTRDCSDSIEIQDKKDKKEYRRSARAQARSTIKSNATSIIQCWSVTPFKWKVNTFKCAYCDVDCSDTTLLRQHVANCSKTRTIKDIYRKFREMALINVDISNARCNICGVGLSDVGFMKSHVSEHGLKLDENQPDGVLPFILSESWDCVLCRETFNNFLKLYEHMNVHYQHYICDICGKGYMSAPRLRKHSEVHIAGNFPCNQCNKVFNMRAARDYHKSYSHRNKPRYQCPRCDVRFTSYNERMCHLNTEHREKEVSYNCYYCTLSFSTSGKRSNHIKTVHFPVKPSFNCEFCEWKFKTSYELKRHMVKHTGERNFSCLTCGKSFSRVLTLRTHMRTHEDLKCKWCGIGFKQKSLLSNHLRSSHPEYV